MCSASLGQSVVSSEKQPKCGPAVGLTRAPHRVFFALELTLLLSPPTPSLPHTPVQNRLPAPASLDTVRHDRFESLPPPLLRRRLYARAAVTSTLQARARRTATLVPAHIPSPTLGGARHGCICASIARPQSTAARRSSRTRPRGQSRPRHRRRRPHACSSTPFLCAHDRPRARTRICPAPPRLCQLPRCVCELPPAALPLPPSIAAAAARRSIPSSGCACDLCRSNAHHPRSRTTRSSLDCTAPVSSACFWCRRSLTVGVALCIRLTASTDPSRTSSRTEFCFAHQLLPLCATHATRFRRKHLHKLRVAVPPQPTESTESQALVESEDTTCGEVNQ